MNNLLTVPEVAAILRISESSLRDLVRRGKIPGKKLGPRTLRFDPEAINRWRKLFFDNLEESQDVTEEKRQQKLGLSDDGQWQDVGAFHRGERQAKGASQNPRNDALSPTAQKAAKRLLEIEARNRQGS